MIFAMTKEQYIKITEPLRSNQERAKRVTSLNHMLTALVFCVYPLYLFMLFYILFNKCSSRNAQKKDYKSLEKMKLILKFVENNYMEKITIEDVAKEVSLSQSHFMKYFKNTMGTSFIDYLNEYRLTMASRLLISSDSSILDIAAEVGFDNLSYFNRSFKKRFQQTPREYRKRYAQP